MEQYKWIGLHSDRVQIESNSMDFTKILMIVRCKTFQRLFGRLGIWFQNFSDFFQTKLSLALVYNYTYFFNPDLDFFPSKQFVK